GGYGGNMDYNQVREGVTLYFPVNHAGALLYVGDGHAAQGDGELTGDALETSMEVEFTVDLIQGKSIGGPRAVKDHKIMANRKRRIHYGDRNRELAPRSSAAGNYSVSSLDRGRLQAEPV